MCINFETMNGTDHSCRSSQHSIDTGGQNERCRSHLNVTGTLFYLCQPVSIINSLQRQAVNHQQADSVFNYLALPRYVGQVETYITVLRADNLIVVIVGWAFLAARGSTSEAGYKIG